MGKDLRGKELGRGISQREDGLYVARYTNKYGKRVQKVLPKLQELRQWLADEGYRTSTIYQTRIALFNMLDYAYQNDVILKNPCNKMVKSEIGKQSRKKQALTLGQQKEFCKVAVEILKLQKQKNRTFKVIPMLGHSNIGITMNLYVHTTEEQKHKEIDLVADALKVI